MASGKITDAKSATAAPVITAYLQSISVKIAKIAATITPKRIAVERIVGAVKNSLNFILCYIYSFNFFANARMAMPR